ncbi:RHS repeat-associated protein [Arcticibacter pallidicorallinus]|uniref:RHS repeat-associated protein n=1 Tax=Arcticibacter pallidicorallinus TaxID=1259464 RepID=A0A2T0TQX0_9SPHI|nr:DUF6443 domain-containing protein [Arcticibacter pallidicorallinus]PRY48075.1 RHS repeat-associated protein [Arcticibacter pallidicorallinus]
MKVFLYLQVLVFVFAFSRVLGQPPQEHEELSSYSSSRSTVTASGSITLLPGFTVPLGSSFHAYIVSGPSVLCVPLASAMSQNQNYIVTLTPREAFDDRANLLDKSTCEVMQSVQYFDGLGRPLQTVQVKGSPNADKDIVVPVAYDAFGREVKKYLPYASVSNNGSYKTNALTDQQGYYAAPPSGVTAIPNPFLETLFESSPLNRVLDQGAPGAAWQIGGGHTVRTEYSTNNADPFNSGNTTGSRRVALYTATVGANNTRALSRANNNAVYAGSQLYLTIIRDENWRPEDGCLGTNEEYKDKQGQVVLKRTYNKKGSATEMLSTYYVYDDYGNLSFVLPPASNPDANAAISTATLNDLCYQYRYDGRNQMTGKKVPGKGWELMIYNPLDQLVLSQDAEQRAKSPQEWSFTKYNAFGQVVMTGLYTDASGAADAGVLPNDARRTALQTQVSNQPNILWESRLATASAAETGYTNITFPTTVALYLSINYYDDYAFPGGNPYLNNYSQMCKGLLTGSRIKVLKEAIAAGTTDMLWNINYYDDRGRVVHSYNQHYKGGSIAVENYDETLNSYNFTDEVVVSTRLHRASGAAMVKVITEYEYDHMGRKKRTYQQIGDNAGDRVELASLRYNEVGQLKDKALHNNLQSTSYSYNPRGWLKTSISPQFGMTLKYEDGASPQWNGNISAQEWSGGSYAYNYDKLNRLVSGIAADGRSEKSIDYDLNGNIMGLQRYTSASAQEDGLRYYYNGSNRLQSVFDSVTTYASNQYQQPGTTGYNYDLNGNMTARTHSVNSQNSINEIKYNVLNLPRQVTLGNGTVIQYVYDASGRKLRKLVGAAATEYISGIQYTGTTLDFIQTEEGRIVNNGGSYKYEYNLSDHLGNVRYSFDSYNASVRQLQRDDYYPFGLRIARVAGTVANKYLYNGKEIQDELNQYDYGWRFYDPVIARWNTVDPLADEYEEYSPYNYTLNNPVNAIDPDGQWVQPAIRIAQAVLRNPVVQRELSKLAVAAGAYIGGRAVITHARNNIANRDATNVVTNTSPTSQAVTPSKAQIAKMKAKLESSSSDGAQKQEGSIYKVPGSATKSGKPYVGRHNKLTPQETRKSDDGRDRTQAEVIDTYDPSNREEGQYKEQKAMDNNGGVENLDNKRREVSEKRMKDLEKKQNGN